MKSHVKSRMVVWILFTILCSGCIPKAIIPQTPELGISINEFNSRIHLEAPKGWNKFELNRFVNINVDVISDDQIAFRHDYGARIFQLKDDQWEEIPNVAKYPEGYILLTPSKGDPFKQGEASVLPILEEKNQPVRLRIVLIGNIYRDGKITDEQTAGFIDVILKPKPN